ncbi:MAG: hypothetical protein L6R30_04635 [Thermoanaerobaculia bacterium]|nr:hypothetical protein [Thermoanaerobaculia bacterium]MCK6681691.1 hypothetical protein [Thermoanaerobaculia bacterium]
MRFSRKLALLAAAAVFSTSAFAQQGPKLTIGGTTYTKWLWGNARDQGALFNFKDAPGEGWGDNGQGTEIELLLKAKVSRAVQVDARLHSRFYQNFWTNMGGWGNPSGGNDCASSGTSVGCGEFDPRSNQYVKLRGVTVTLTPGYKWIDSATIGSSDWGMFDPFVVGRIRYIDRDNVAGLLFQGSAMGRKMTWDVARISLPRLFAGPSYNTGNFHAADGAYVFQSKIAPNSMFDMTALMEWVNDLEVNAKDINWDNGKETRMRFRQTVFGGKLGFHPSAKVDVRAAGYYSTYESANDLAPADFFGVSGFSPVPAGKHKDWSGKLNLDFIDPFDVGLTFNIEAFHIGAEYASVMAARRESDVLLTEGHDGTWSAPGPTNASYGVFGGNPTIIGYGGWSGNAQQVATINVDNQFTDFNEPMAESAIGWEGITFQPVFQKGALDMAAEYSYISYDTNWQAWGNPNRAILSSLYPNMESDAGLGHYRNAYAPFQDKTTQIALVRGKYVLPVGKGIDLFGKIKFIDETDKRMNEARYLPYKAGDCATSGTLGCKGEKNFYSPGNSTADLYGNPEVITVNGVTGYKWKPFNSLSDDDRDMSYFMFNLGGGYQFTNDFYSSLEYVRYNVDLKDGNTAFQAYNLHEMASGYHKKNQIIWKIRYTLGGISECGMEYQYNFGSFEPDFGGGFVPQRASADVANSNHVEPGSLGFQNRFGGWNSLETRDFSHQRLKAYMKILF